MAATNQPKLVVSIWILCVVPLIFMLLRFWCKRKRSRNFSLDDSLLLGSWVAIFLFTVLIQVAVNHGLGKHLKDIPQHDLPRVYKFMFVGQYWCFWAMPLGKASFCVTLLRLTPIRWQKMILWTVMIVFFVGMIATGILQWAQCDPVQKLFDASIPGKCLDYSVFITVSIIIGSLSSATDFMLALCPWIIIRKVQMRARKKASLVIAMSMGCLAGVACIVKTTRLPAAAKAKDITYNATELLIWAISESSITVIAASLPFLRPMLPDHGTHTSKRGRSDGSFRLTDRTTSLHTRHTSWHGQRQDRYMAEVDSQEYESDEKSMLPTSKTGPSQIRQVQEIRIEYTDRGSRSPIQDKTVLPV